MRKLHAVVEEIARANADPPCRLDDAYGEAPVISWANDLDELSIRLLPPMYIRGGSMQPQWICEHTLLGSLCVFLKPLGRPT